MNRLFTFVCIASLAYGTAAKANINYPSPTIPKTETLKEDNQARDLVDQSYKRTLGKTSKTTTTMKIVRPEWSREVKMTTWSLGTEYFLIFIDSPAREHGQTFLKRKNNMWNWIPSIGRSIKIPPSMMLSSWMGSDFNNNELMKQNSLVVDYTHKIVGEEVIEGYKCKIVELTPLPTAAVVWGKVLMSINPEHSFALKTLYYDSKGKLVKQLNNSEVKRFGDRLLPATLEMIPVDKKGHKTILHTDEAAFNVKGISVRMFSQQKMKSIRH